MGFPLKEPLLYGASIVLKRLYGVSIIFKIKSVENVHLRELDITNLINRNLAVLAVK